MLVVACGRCLGELQEVVRVAIVETRATGVGREKLEGILPDRLEHPEANLPGRVLALSYEAVVDESGERL